jgi:hypothetical protein
MPDSSFTRRSKNLTKNHCVLVDGYWLARYVTTALWGEANPTRIITAIYHRVRPFGPPIGWTGGPMEEKLGDVWYPLAKSSLEGLSTDDLATLLGWGGDTYMVTAPDKQLYKRLRDELDKRVGAE